jgi:ribose 1,5-bisphosphokinase
MALDMCVAPQNPRLFYVMGPSGAGKDSLIAYCRDRLAGRPVVFAHRYITRPAAAGGENHVALSDSEFATRSLAGCFALQWHSHDLMYGIGIEIDAWLERGLSVVVNGSRQWLGQATERYPHLTPVAITVDPQCLRRRLEARGRETAEQIVERLAKVTAFAVSHPALVTIDNSGPLEQAGEEALALFSGQTRVPV